MTDPGEYGNMALQIKTSYFVAGVVLDNDHVIQAPPILKYMQGWDTHQIVSYCMKKGWIVERVK